MSLIYPLVSGTMLWMSRKLTDKVKSLLEEEKGTVFKDHSNRLRFALAFPNIYRIGMATLGMQIVYKLINNESDVLAERVFLPDPDDLTEYQRTGTRLFSVESQTPVADFDVLAFSVSFEMDYVHILQMLKLAGIPLRSADRDETHPLVIAGGPAVTFNPEPLAGFLDAVVIGDSEEVVPEIVDILRNHASGSRDDLLQKLCGLEGVYIPRFYTPEYEEDGTISSISAISPAPAYVKRRLTRDLDAFDGSSAITTPNCEFPNMLFTEAMRGCCRQCRFCVAGYMSLPPRPREIRTDADNDSRLGLVGSAVFDHPDSAGICRELEEAGRDFSVSSIRIETLTQELADMMYRAGQRTMTIAPEAGSERLRRLVNKPLSDEQIIEAVRIGQAAGFDRVKLYYMIGLPGEDDGDIEGIISLASKLSSLFRDVHFQLSVSCYVPKPWTPFQWCGMEKDKVLSSKLQLLQKKLRTVRKVQLSSESPRLALIQALLARGDRKLAGFLELAAESGNYAKSLAEASVDVAFYVNRTRDKNEVFPWDHLDLRVGKEHLWSELQKAFDLKITSPCNVGICQRCGVC